MNYMSTFFLIFSIICYLTENAVRGATLKGVIIVITNNITVICGAGVVQRILCEGAGVQMVRYLELTRDCCQLCQQTFEKEKLFHRVTFTQTFPTQPS